MKKTCIRLLAICLCLAMVAGFIPAMPPAVTAEAATANTSTALYNSYTTITTVPTQSGCPAMQGFEVDDTYLYCVKINTTTETSATIARIHKDTGAITWLTNSATGTVYFSQLAHANDLAVTTVNGVKTMFVATGSAGKGAYSLVRLAFNGTTLTEVAHYNVKLNGTETPLAGVKVMSVNDTEIKLLLKYKNYMYTATVGANQASSDVALTSLCTLNFSEVNINGTIHDFSQYVVQGFGYYDNKIFIPRSGNYDGGTTSNASIILCYDINGASGTIKNDPSMSVWITDTTYLDLFEIESCAICPSDGRLYFGTNRRKTSSDGTSDGVHYVKNYVYSPSAGDSPDSSNYRWEVSNGALNSVTDGGAMYNHPIQHLGSISGNTITGGRFSLDQTVYLKHDQPWIIEWKSSSWTSNALLLSTYSKSSYAGNQFLFRRNNSDLIALGEHDGSQYNNYGIKLSEHGVDGSKTHVYRLENRIASDGSNMVYLLVDGKELGAMNNYYIATTSQNTTSNWVSGKDFAFSYIGTPQHPLTCSMEYMQIWDKGILSQVDEPNIYRWETQSDVFTNVESFGLSSNAVTTLGGSCASGVFSGAHFSIKEEMVLLHDRPWTVEWKSEGSGTSRFISTFGSSRLTPYILKSNVVAMGYWDGTQYQNYGIKLSDYNIDQSLSHVYRMTNKINADGSNMVYLSVDGVELGAMNNLYYGGTFQRSDANWISGQDFTFGYIGTFQHSITDFTVDYLQVWENGIPAEHESNNYRWETQTSTFANITNGYTQNTATALSGSISNGTFSDSYFRLEESVVLLHNQNWSIEWQSEGDWKDSSNGAFLLSGSAQHNALHIPYLYRRNGSDIIALGERADGTHQNYGVNLSDHGIDGTVAHVYRLENRVNTDGSNMVYLLVDGVELGAMNNYYQGSTATGTTSNWVSGKDFVFNCIGGSTFSLGNCSIGYMQINEGCSHSFGNWSTNNATCTESATQTRTCTLCGETESRTVSATGHSYSGVVTKPTCTAIGYTTYTCTKCGDSYTGDSVAATGHSYSAVVTAPTCTADGYTTYTCTTCGNSYTADTVAATGHSFANGYCTVCVAEDPDFAKDYYLFGYINGANYACEEDYANLGIYKFVNGKLTATFDSDSYVAVKSADNENWYMTNGWQGNVTSVTLYNTKTSITADKLFVPGGVKVGFVLVDNGDDTFQLSYEIISCPHTSHGTDGLCLICDKAVAHSYSSTVTAATCTAAGYTTYTCTICGTSYIGNQVSATGHSYVSRVTAPTCTTSGYTTYTCSKCGNSYVSNQTSATGHSYVNGSCTACGASDPDYVKVPTLTLSYPTLAFEDEILYNAYFTVSDASSVVEMGMITFSSRLTNGTIADAVDVISGYTTSGSNYIVHSNGVPAKNLGDALYFKVYAKLSNGTYAYSDVAGYNAVAYAKTILNSSSSSAKAKALVVAMLNYGAAAQVYFDYNTGSLMNASLTADQLALVDEYSSSMVADVVASTKSGNFVNNGGYSRIYPTVSFESAFAINYYFATNYTPDSAPTFYYWDAATYNSVTTLTKENATGTLSMTLDGDQWFGTVAGIAAKEIDQTYYVAGIYTAGGTTYTSPVISYSLGKYCQTVAANGEAFGAATAVYGYYAKAYFA